MLSVVTSVLCPAEVVRTGNPALGTGLLAGREKSQTDGRGQGESRQDSLVHDASLLYFLSGSMRMSKARTAFFHQSGVAGWPREKPRFSVS